MKRFEKFVDYFIYAFLGIALAYFVDSVIAVILPQIEIKIHQNSGHEKKKSNENIEKLIISENIFDVDTGLEKKKVVSVKKAKVVSSINGYKLVGFIRGSDPMVLLKKYGKPIAIVTKNKGLDKVWFLYKIEFDGVYLKNKKTGEVKLFKFSSAVGKSPTLTLLGSQSISTSSSSSGVEKVTVSKSILGQVDNLNVLLRQINIVPVFKNGKAYGYVINYLSPNSVLRKIGLKVGDVIVSINGQPTTDPSALMGLYAQLKDLNSVSINLIRNSQKKTIFVQIE